MSLIHNEIIIDPQKIANILRQKEEDTALYILSILKEKLGEGAYWVIDEVCKRYNLRKEIIR